MTTKPRPIVIERIIAKSPGLVWQALTDITLLRKWQPHFTEFVPEVGFITEFDLGASNTKVYRHICEVTEVIKERRITYSWRYKGHPGDSYVTFDIIPVRENVTKLTLTYRITEPFSTTSPDFSLNNFEEGWTSVINKLSEYMEQ